MENRDVWNTSSISPIHNRSRADARLELGPIYFDYYFFDENCSYYLLELLETARPDLDLTSEFPLVGDPVRYVREVVKQKGLVKRTVYRPSNARHSPSIGAE